MKSQRAGRSTALTSAPRRRAAAALAAAHIKARFSIGYADAFAIVAARDHGGMVLTGDPEFKPLAAAGVVAVAWLPRRRS
jgi:hypothetical protein